MEMPTMELNTSEWDYPDPTIPIRQGDLLFSSDPNTRNMAEVCLVITADCDISQSKYGKQLACLRVITHEEYVKTIWSAKKLEKAVKTEVEKVQAKLNKWNRLRSGGGGEITTEAAISWVQRADPQDICEVLGIPEEERRKEGAVIEVLKKGLGVLDARIADNKMTQASAFRAVTQGKDPKDCFLDYVQQAQNEKLPEDIFFLPSLPQLEIGPAVIMLREVIGVNIANVTSVRLIAE